MAGEWNKRTLDNCATFYSGGTPSKAVDEYWTGTIPWVSAKDMKKFRLNDAEDHVTPQAIDAGSRLVPPGTILLLVRGMTLHNDVPICVAMREMAFNQDLKALRPKEGIDGSFLTYWLLAHKPALLGNVDSAGHGTGRLNTDTLKAMIVSVPPLAEQKAIAAVLGALDDKIELNRRMNATLEALARALFQSWFVDFDPVRAKLDGRPPAPLAPATAALFPEHLEDSPLGHIPVGWRLSKITDCCERIHSGGTPRRDEPKYWNDATIPWLTSGEVRQPMITATENFISELGLKDSSAKWVPANSTVVALYGATAGQVSFLGSTATTNQAICSLIPKPQFAYFNYFTMRGATAEMENKAVGSAQQNISKGIIEETSVVLPSAEFLARFNLAVGPLFENWISNISESRTLATLRDTLLPKLLSGELSVPTAETIFEDAT